MKYFKFYRNFLILIFFITSCKGETNIKSKTDLLSDSEIERQSSIINKTGNPIVYGHLVYYFKRTNSFEKISPIAMVMSDKYNNKEAMYDAYHYYPFYRGVSSFDELKKSEKRQALNYLINAYELGDTMAEEVVIDYLSKNKFLIKETSGKLVIFID